MDIESNFPEINLINLTIDSKESIKNKYYNFSKKYFEELRKNINETYSEYNKFLDIKKVKFHDYLMFELIRPNLEKELEKLEKMKLLN